MAEPIVWARRPFTYGDLNLDRGQITKLLGLRNDEKLLRLGFVEAVKGKPETWECGTCFEKFLEMEFRDAHVKRHHRAAETLELGVGTPVNPGGTLSIQQDGRSIGDVQGFVDKTGEREERLLNEVAPLYMDKTKAARGVKA